MKKEENGFTLVELLAVIAILAILVVLALPNVLKNYKKAKKQIFVTELQTLSSTITDRYSKEDSALYKDKYVYCKSKTDENSPLDLGGHDKYYYGELDKDGNTVLLVVWDDDQYIKYSINSKREIKDLNVNDVVSGDMNRVTCSNAASTFSSSGSNSSYAITHSITPYLDSNHLNVSFFLPSAEKLEYDYVNFEVYRKVVRSCTGVGEEDYTKIKNITLTNKDEKFMYSFDDEFEELISLKVDYKIIAYAPDGTQIGSTTDQYIYCFVAGTKVLTNDGYKNIEDIKVGDMVYSYNVDTNELELKKVTNTLESSTTETYIFTINGKNVEMSLKHQLYIVDKGWLRAYEVKTGDKMLSAAGEVVEITNIEYKKYDTPIKTYNLTVDGNSNYFVTDVQVLVHNAASFTCY